jgi:putative ABC transport system permease protein
MDIRLALRQLIRRPGFAAIAIITLALGIGAPTAMFSVVHAVLLRPLPYPEPDRLVQFEINAQSPAGPVSFDALPAAEALDWAATSRTIAGLALFNDSALTLSTTDGPFRLTGVSATPNLFAILGVTPLAGVTFAPESLDAHEVVLSHATWQRFFAGNTATIGSLITMDGDQYRVVGVMPPAFGFPSAETAFWVPQVMTSGGTRGMLLPAVARLRPAATVDGVANEGRRLIDDGDPQFKTTLVVRTLQDQMTGGVNRILWVLLGAVGLVTAIATTNLALLLITRGAGREREFSIRAALGAGRGRLVRQLFIEALTLGTMGGMMGVGLASAALSLLVRLAPADVPRLSDATLDASVLSFALALTIGTSLLFGVLSVGRILDLRPWRVLAGRTKEIRLVGQALPHRRRLNALAVAELALTMVLLVAAGLLLRSFVALVTADQGFDSRGAVALQVNLPASRYPTPNARLAFDQRLLERLRQTPGVSALGLTTTLPTRQATGRFGFSSSPSILSTVDPRSMPVIDVHMISEGFIEAMGLRLAAGRTFTAADRAGAEPVIVISEEFAKQQFPSGSAVDQILYSRSGNKRVVGVVADVRPAALGAAPKPDAYLPIWQNSDVLQWFSSVTVIARAEDTAGVTNALRPAVLSLDSQSPPYNIRVLEADVSKVVAGPRFSATVLGMFAGVALLMACVGVYGVMAYVAGLRTREVGIRLAVGATRAQVVSLMLKDSAVVVGLGLALGLAAAMLLTSTLTGLLHEVRPADPATLAAVTALLAAAGFTASYLPARRATRLDPLKALRED